MEYDYFHEIAAFSVAVKTYICLVNALVIEEYIINNNSKVK
jgi:hypothetical protein